jgi:hypothetical protein
MDQYWGTVQGYLNGPVDVAWDGQPGG